MIKASLIRTSAVNLKIVSDGHFTAEVWLSEEQQSSRRTCALAQDRHGKNHVVVRIVNENKWIGANHQRVKLFREVEDIGGNLLSPEIGAIWDAALAQ